MGHRQEKYKRETEGSQEERERLQKRRGKNRKAGRRETRERKNSRKDRTKRGRGEGLEGRIKGKKGGVWELAAQGVSRSWGGTVAPMSPTQEGVERKGRQDLESLTS